MNHDVPKPIGTGEGESPLAPFRPASAPPTPAPTQGSSSRDGNVGAGASGPFEARTFSSDLSSIRATGGGSPQPYTPSARPANPPSGASSAAPASPRPSEAQAGAPSSPPIAPPPGLAVGTPFSVSSPSTGMKPPSFTPASGTATPAPIPPPGNSAKGKKIFVVILSALVVLALGAAGYFFVYPLFVSEPAPVAEDVSPAPTLPEPESPAPEPPADESPPAVEAPSVDPFQGISGISSHRSLFRAPADTATEIILAEPTLEALKRALPSGSVATPSLAEIIFKMPSGSVFPFSRVAALFAPTFFTAERLASFDEDATYFLYASSNGTWFGIAAPLKPGVPIGPVQDGMAALQSDPDLARFFIANPGERGVWADGSVRNKPASQVSFEAPGSTFSYTWLNRTLLLSTNLTAAEVAGERLGF